MRNLNKKLGATLLVGFILLCCATLQARKPSLSKTPIGTPITLKALFDEINANNPQKNSDFLVFTGNAWKSANLKGWINETPQNGQVLVTLAQDPIQIANLMKAGHLDAPTAAFYAKYLLYFTLNGNKIYINNPWPGQLILNRDKKTMEKKTYTRNPARDIMAKWQEWATDDATFKAAVTQAYPAPAVTTVTTPATTTTTKSTKKK